MKQAATYIYEKIIKSDGQFCVNQPYVQKRTGNYDRQKSISDKWDNYSGSISGCGNVCHEFFFDTEKQTFLFDTALSHSEERYVSMYRVISPSLLMYRLIATFFGSPVCSGNYKSIWEYNLLHKESGRSISFSEWKGAAGFWLPETDHKKVNKNLKSDLIELMNYLISNECAHPYDGLVAGSVA